MVHHYCIAAKSHGVFIFRFKGAFVDNQTVDFSDRIRVSRRKGKDKIMGEFSDRSMHGSVTSRPLRKL